MTIQNKYKIGQKVYLITDEEQKERIVTAIVVRPGVLVYEIGCVEECSSHYEFEVTDEKIVK